MHYVADSLHTVNMLRETLQNEANGRKKHKTGSLVAAVPSHVGISTLSCFCRCGKSRACYNPFVAFLVVNGEEGKGLGQDMKRYLTDETRRFECSRLHAQPCPSTPEMQLVKVYPGIEFQRITGFGGALTEASGYVYANMPPSLQGELLRLYFGEDGNRYSLGRLSVQSCDFSLGPRSYLNRAPSGNRRGDGPSGRELSGFSVDDDFAYVVPLALDALAVNPRMEFLASPWSPPAWAKSNRSMKHGGHLLHKHYGTWAAMMARFVRDYREIGIPVTRLTVQNEPAATQTWESCRFTADQERLFLVDYLKPALQAAGVPEVKVLAWDHNKENALDRTMCFLADERAAAALDGIAFHWYSGDHFEALELVRDLLGPGKELIFSEGCDCFTAGDPTRELPHAEHYAHEVIGDLQAGANAVFDWNILLDERGGPNHVGNFCDAPVMFNRATGHLNVRLPYYYLGHFSRFIHPGARRVMSTRYTASLETCAFRNEDGTYALVVLNRTDWAIPFHLAWGATALDRRLARTEAPPHSIQTITWQPRGL